MPRNPTAASAFQTLVLATLFAVLIGYILYIGKALLLPIFVAVICVYILVAASDWLGRQPITQKLPRTIRTFLVIAIFLLTFVTLCGVVVSTAENLAAQAPKYRQNLVALFSEAMTALGLDVAPDWESIWQRSFGHIQIQTVLTSILSSVSSLAGVMFMVIIYAMFLMGERSSFAKKIATALPGESAEQTQQIVRDINRRVGDYIAVKTLANAILAAISFVVLWIFGVDFALFWAILIGLLNYIPYVGSMLGVVFPVLLTMAQFGAIQTTIFVALLLIAAQMWVGNVLEPRMVGKKVNMSPFVVLVSLSLWSSLWGIPGAILAIPLTSIVAIVLAAFDLTRPLAILLAEDVTVFHEKDA